MLMLYAVLGAAQHLQQRKAIRLNNISRKKTVVVTYTDGKQKDSFTCASTSFNHLGYPLEQIILKKDGGRQSRFVSEYISDSLEVKETSFDSIGQINTEIFNTYDASGQLISMKAVFNYLKRKPVHHVFEHDNNSTIMRDFIVENGQKTLMALNEYDQNHRLLKSSYYDLKGQVRSISTYEYDSIDHTEKSYSIKNGIQRLRSVKNYSADEQLTGEIHYYDNVITLSDGNGNVQNFKKGDIRMVSFYYSNGLLKQQVETVNNEISLKLLFEYY